MQTNSETRRINREENFYEQASVPDRESLEDKAVLAMLRELIRKDPQSDTAIQLSAMLGWEQEPERAETEFPWILFSLGGTAYGINSKYVLSIEILGEITPIIDAPHYTPGITRSRGEMIDILDMRALFGSGDYRSAKEDNPDAIYMMVVTEVNNVKRGLIVDEIISVEYITKFVDEVIGAEGGLESRYVERVARREKTDEPVLILKPENLVTL